MVEDRIRRIVNEGRALTDGEEPGTALFAFLRSMVLQWGATNKGLADALAGWDRRRGPRCRTEAAFLRVLGDLLKAAQKAGTVRGDLDVRDVKTILVGCLAMQAVSPDGAERLTEVVMDGLRTV